jgi:hypothetical protein
LGAALVTALAMSWSVPNYFAAVPSYYNLFFATFGMAALVRFVDTGRRHWLGLAGACGGLSFLVKSAGGLYFAAAAILFLVWREQQTAHAELGDAPVKADDHRRRPLLVVKILGAALTLFALFRLSPAHGAMELLHFVLPGTLVALVICRDEARGGSGSFPYRLRRVWFLLSPFALGFAIPLLLFVVPFVWSGALDDLITGVFVLPARRFDRASFALPPLGSLWPVLPYAAVLILASRGRPPRLHRASAALIAGLLLVLVAAAANSRFYQVVWNSARHLGLFAVAAGCVLITSPDRDSRKRQLVFLAVAMSAFMTLLQIPFAAPIYFAYTAPFIILALTAAAAESGAARPHAAVAIAYLLFAVLWMNPSYIWALGSGYLPNAFVPAPWLQRADITMFPHDRDEYSRLVQTLSRVPGNMVAFPDCPEVYFLTARRNPTRFIYEFLTPHRLTTGELLRSLDTHDIAIVVINTDPHFSPKPDAALLRELTARYPYSLQTGRFVVRWKL